MKESRENSKLPGRTARSIAVRAAGFAALWWVLAEGRLEDPWIAVVCLGIALAVSLRLLPPGTWPFRPRGLIGFIPFFLLRSVQGGIDVAHRAFRPAMPLHPEIVTHRLRGSPLQAILLAWIVSLLPGTASVRLDRNVLHVHVLDSKLPIRKNLRDLERRVAAICD
jgi:multicomponent Na+:H+ antiporter subunit E